MLHPLFAVDLRAGCSMCRSLLTDGLASLAASVSVSRSYHGAHHVSWHAVPPGLGGTFQTPQSPTAPRCTDGQAAASHVPRTWIQGLAELISAELPQHWTLQKQLPSAVVAAAVGVTYTCSASCQAALQGTACFGVVLFRRSQDPTSVAASWLSRVWGSECAGCGRGCCIAMGCCSVPVCRVAGHHAGCVP